MIHSQFDPLAVAPQSLRARFARKFGRTVEPMAVRLLSWCRSLDHRVESIEGRLGAEEAKLRTVSQAMRGVEGIGMRLEAVEALAPKVAALVPKIATMTARDSAVEEKVRALETRVDQTFWGREALVERMNQGDAREEEVVARLAALEERAEQLYWGREALVERLNRADAVVEAMGRRVGEEVGRRIEGIASKLEEQASWPKAVDLDRTALSRRLAALEDGIEALLGQTDRATSVDLVAFPAPASVPVANAPEKAVG